MKFGELQNVGHVFNKKRETEWRNSIETEWKKLATSGANDEKSSPQANI
jgi:hypothetical protein